MQQNDKTCRSFWDLMYSFSMFNVTVTINVCTRVTENTAASIDNLLINKTYSKPKVIINDVSHRYSIIVFCDIIASHYGSINRNCFNQMFLWKVMSQSLGKSWAGLIGPFLTSLPLLVKHIVNGTAKSMIFLVKYA